jgi:hypothetical protein
MRRSIRLAVTMLPVAALTACSTHQPAPDTNNNSAIAAGTDPVTSTTTEAMCANAADRAHAIARIARDPIVNGDPDEVYDIAATIAEKGCPKPKS